jgi:hypothetical protein
VSARGISGKRRGAGAFRHGVQRVVCGNPGSGPLRQLSGGFSLRASAARQAGRRPRLLGSVYVRDTGKRFAFLVRLCSNIESCNDSSAVAVSVSQLIPHRFRRVGFDAASQVPEIEFSAAGAPSICLNQPSNWFQLAKMRLTSLRSMAFNNLRVQIRRAPDWNRTVEFASAWSTWCLWPAGSPPTAANPRVADHSDRSAFHASVLAARLAGMRAAERATTVTIASTPARMAGCEGSRRRENGRPRAGSPGPPGDRELFPRLRAHRLGRESASGSNRRCSDCDSYSDFARSLSDRKRDFLRTTTLRDRARGGARP